MDAVSTNKIADILHFSNNYKELMSRLAMCKLWSCWHNSSKKSDESLTVCSLAIGGIKNCCKNFAKLSIAVPIVEK